MSLILVTGGAGFIGSHTVDELLRRGNHVRVLDNLQPRVHPNGKPDYLPDDVDFIEGDVANKQDMRIALDDVDAVFHLAAYQDYLPDFSTFIHTNTESTALLFELAARDRLPLRKIVFASSQSVSGEGKYSCVTHGDICPSPRPIAQLRQGDWEVHCPKCGGPLAPLLIDEGTVLPATAYAVSKYAIELLARALGERCGIATVSMRYTYVQGPRNSIYNAYSGVARRFAMRLMQGLPPVCYEDGGQLRDYVNVSDVAKANVLAMEDARADGKVFNVGGGRAITVLDFARMMAREFKSEVEPEVPGEFRLGDTRHTVSDIASIRELGWEPTTPVEQNVSQYVAWLRDQGSTKQYLEEADRVMRAQGVVQRVVA